MAYTDNLNNSTPIFNHPYRAGSVDANRKGLLWMFVAFAILAVFGALYWMNTRNENEDILSPQTKEKVERPFNSSVLPASESTPVNQ